MPAEIKSLIAQIEAIGQAALSEIGSAEGSAALEELRVRHMGKKSALSQALSGLKDIPGEERKSVGQVANQVKSRIKDALGERRSSIEAAERDSQLGSELIDVTLAGRPTPEGRLHPLTRILTEIEDIFIGMGFELASGPDMEHEYQNFDALNIPEAHPARDMHDTFYLRGGGLLRTHTSPVQIRTMQSRTPPMAILAPGKAYRCENADNTHSPVFHQVEGFMIDRKVRFSDLKGVLSEFLRQLLGPDIKYRFRPSYFPFTEPSAEVDILWSVDGRKPDWMEVLGSGMIHPNVLEAGGIDKDQYSGFAFGLGVERFAMLKYGIPSIRLFYENDLRFLGQF